MKALAADGACGFTDDGIPLKDAAFLLKAMELAAQLNLPISLHEEDPSFIEINGINHGAASDFLGIYGSPSIAEESLVARDCMHRPEIRCRCRDPAYQFRNFRGTGAYF